MIIKQISVFMENKAGFLSSVIDTLAEKNINIEAFSIAETSDYGILRLIVDKIDEAHDILTKCNLPHSINDVLAVMVEDHPGALSGILKKLADNGISLEYSYAFLSRNTDNACIILRVTDNNKAQEILQ